MVIRTNNKPINLRIDPTKINLNILSNEHRQRDIIEMYFLDRIDTLTSQGSICSVLTNSNIVDCQVISSSFTKVSKILSSPDIIL